MKHVTYADKSLLLDDETADLLIEYAVALGAAGRTDSVVAQATDSSGHDVEATFLLNGGTEMMTESARTSREALDNTAAIAYLREHIDLLRNPPETQPEQDDGAAPAGLDPF